MRFTFKVQPIVFYSWILLSWQASAIQTVQCETVVEPQQLNVALDTQTFTLHQIPVSLWPKTKLLTVQDKQMIVGFGSPKVGAAIRYIASLKGKSNTEIAMLWMELVDEIKLYMPNFTSRIFVMPGNRFLFVGDEGEKLFIDSTGLVYRVDRLASHKFPKTFQHLDTWKFQYQDLRLETPRPD